MKTLTDLTYALQIDLGKDPKRLSKETFAALIYKTLEESYHMGIRNGGPRTKCEECWQPVYFNEGLWRHDPGAPMVGASHLALVTEEVCRTPIIEVIDLIKKHQQRLNAMEHALRTLEKIIKNKKA